MSIRQTLLSTLIVPAIVLCRPVQAADKSGCDMVQQALAAYQAIKPGITRKQVEDDFKEEGGGQFREQTRYTYKGCRYIKVNIDFASVGDPKQLIFSPDDKVTGVSKLYIEYPIKD